MDEPTIIYCLSLYRGNRCVGCVRTQSAGEAQERSEQWCGHGEGHTARIEREEKPQAQHQEPIPPVEYLTQSNLKGLFR
jgi:hypothetical protein